MFLKLEILPFPDDHMVSTHPSFRSLSKYHLNKIHPMTVFKIILAPHFQGISVFSSFSKHLLHSWILSTFSPIPHPMKAGIFVHFVDELVHSQQWCAGACLDHIMGHNWAQVLEICPGKRLCLYIWRGWQPTPGFFPGEFHGQRNLVGYSPWGRKESDMTEQLIFFYPNSDSFHILFLKFFNNQFLRFYWVLEIDYTQKLFQIFIHSEIFIEYPPHDWQMS